MEVFSKGSNTVNNHKIKESARNRQNFDETKKSADFADAD